MHFNGNLYCVDDVSKHSESREIHMIYRQMYGDKSLWIRPIDMFLKEFDHKKYPDIEQK